MYVIISYCERTLNSINYNRPPKKITEYNNFVCSIFLRSKKHFKINNVNFLISPQGQISSGYLNTTFFCFAAAV